MKRIAQRIALVCLLAFAGAAHAEIFQLTWGPVTATGPLGAPLNYRQFGSVPSAYTIDWFNDGTAATACTFQVEGASDGVHWHALTSSIDCSGSDMIHIANKPVMYVRINILTFTSGGGSTAVTFKYTRGQ